mmetsp:Transcript_105234/g.280147  ORF Transcript_105234/g.280147 Transcript_105234/m.280147 type:complete len:227 (-) Transcript_105234:36-716(-)|eukprot:CAMPEP_0171204594 /NCGR_PEP_ID=MMETSP0790-20130122/26121_1 /TAXON_ID=2925 /ORGANISM="Alexandrium catenella, Strain OF101" /LENGTH=226 /DNA_ID=CAMNT_0011670099 /DNA_START=64 /DNA_END=744 /DNA_ORIENTATION=+
MALDDVRQVFRAWDKEGNGMISRKEFSGIIMRLSPEIGEQELEALFDAADANAGGRLNYEQFFTWLWAPDGDEDGSLAKDAELEKARERGLWEGALTNAISKYSEKYPAEKVTQYFDEVQNRLGGQEYAAHVKGAFFKRVDKNEDGKVDFQEAFSLIRKSLQCAADLGAAEKPTVDEIRAAFDAHDTLVSGRGRMGVDEFLNLTRYLQVRVAEAMLPLSQLVRGGC